ncbi:MAG: lysophospholipid acyltransferase family protein [bacterium]
MLFVNKREVVIESLWKRFLFWLYQPYKYFIFVPVMALSTAFFGTLVFVLMIFLKPRLVSKICGASWARLNSFMTPMRVTVSGREQVDPNQSYVIVSNHMSHYDIFVLYGWIGIDFKWVMKASLIKVPFLGPACDKLEHIFIDRSNTQAALKSINEAKKRIVNGTSVLFFPEGTRSGTGKMLPFKKGAFKMAIDLNLPLLPITIVGTDKVLPKGTINLLPGDVEMKIHPPIPVTGYDDTTMHTLMQEARRVIQSGL